MVFLKLIVEDFFVCFELTWVGGERWGFVGWGPGGWGPEGGAPKEGALKGGGAQPRKSGAPQGGGPKISRFFSVSCPHVRSFSLSLWVFSWNFGGGLKRQGLEMCTFGVLGLSCASPGGPVWWGRRGFTRQPESPNVHI